MAEGETSELPEDPWDELIHQGDVFPESVRAVPAILAALDVGTDDDASWLYLLAAMCVGRPERRAAEIRERTQAGRRSFRGFLADPRADVRDAAIGALAASGGAGDDDRAEFVRIASDDPDERVRSSAALALGLVEGAEDDLDTLLGDSQVRHAAALALAKRGRTDEPVARALAEALIAAGEASSPTELPPWDALYPDWTDELASLGPAARPAVPLLREALPNAPRWLAPELAEIEARLAENEDTAG